MSLPRLTIYRHDRRNRALITLAGEIDPATAPRVRAALEGCLDDGISTIDVDLTPLGSCDDSGLKVFLDASEHAATAHASLRLHHPSPQTSQLLARTGAAPQLLGPPRAPVLPPHLRDLRRTAPPSSPYGM
ncbi:STAS domain-containing protein [Streptomyces sp. RPA4-2]|uniref:STAS domain-containing protein n=1 Tax=Streptomyces sp. RPA4-2 TaxID=2721244 RepID=UPI00143EB373|nr:STAS domain-containing protein [Streptomyces sp. RPA4-2]QIY63775.1 STAS domain-containing protein [Streptomyces sp. RPA4-2]